ncbi:oxidoreductin [Stachybotrys elegans]|uniref:Cyclin-dependent kinases regulatory subunit n=1 Tax=Stachybotrys elegans TaxID=80388 RepID=A0A8K0SL33_9HYPO|nr:oxidoreductin [Stachybotrys elegans]
MDIDTSRRNKAPRPLSDMERQRLEEFIDGIHYSNRYSDNDYEYRHVQLPKAMLKAIPKEYHDTSKGTLKLLWEDEWRALGITQSLGWEHYEVHEPEPHILLFKWTSAQAGQGIRSARALSHFSVSHDISPKSIVEDACASYATLETINAAVKPVIDDLVQTTDFFSYYRLNLFHKTCPFWDDGNSMCGNIACAVETIDNEENIPPSWRASELSKLEGPLAKHPNKKEQKKHPQKPLQGELGDDVGESCVVEYDDECDERDYCVPEDESASSKGDYVSLVRNPERFTGYMGEGARLVWDAIYRENCFQKSSFPHSAGLGQTQWQPGPAAQDFKQMLNSAGRQMQLDQQRQQGPSTPFVANTGSELMDECLEKRVFYRVVSGMHASISTHLCWQFLNQTTGEWQPNLQCYISRLHEHPERISNLYFNYALLTRAVAKLGPYLQDPDYTSFCTGDPSEDAATRAKVLEVTQRAASVPSIFDETLMFVNGEGPSLKDDFRNRFRNVSRLMDCVGCDKCRLWGKVQTNGYGTALKVLFEFDNDSNDIPVLKRTELVALFNTYARLAESMSSIFKFRGMVEAQAADGPQEAAPEIEDKGEVEDEEEEHIPKKRKTSEPPTFSDEFKQELALVFKASRIVLESWMRIPSALWYIISSETKRLLQFWVGLPVSPRQWRFEVPVLNRDEL